MGKWNTSNMIFIWLFNPIHLKQFILNQIEFQVFVWFLYFINLNMQSRIIRIEEDWIEHLISLQINFREWNKPKPIPSQINQTKAKAWFRTKIQPIIFFLTLFIVQLETSDINFQIWLRIYHFSPHVSVWKTLVFYRDEI